MSDATKAALDAAVAAHFEDEVDGMLQGYVLQSFGQNLEDIERDENGAAKSRYLRAYMEGQSTIVTLGLRDCLDFGVESDCFSGLENLGDD